MEKKYTFCRICEAGCGFVAEVENNKIVKYAPDKEHPFSRGYACIKGRHMLEIQYHSKRLKFPLKKTTGRSERGIFLSPEHKPRRDVLLPDNLNLPDKRIPLVPEDYQPELDKLRKQELPHDEGYPLSLISGRKVETINSWLHALGETNYCYVNPADARNLGIEDGQTVRVSTKIGAIEIPAKLTHDLMSGVVWIPHGWGRTVHSVPEMAVEKRGVSVNLITDDDWTRLEPLGGMVMLDGIPVRVESA